MLLSCEVSSANVPVTWKKDNAVLEDGGRYILKKSGASHSLEIKKLQVEDAGEYCCISRGKKTTAKLIVRGRQTSQMMFYTVLPHILYQPNSMSRINVMPNTNRLFSSKLLSNTSHSISISKTPAVYSCFFLCRARADYHGTEGRNSDSRGGCGVRV